MLTADIRARDPKGAPYRPRARQSRDRQALRSSPALSCLAQTVDRGAYLRLARSMPKACQGLRALQPQRPRLLETRRHPHHAPKAMPIQLDVPGQTLRHMSLDPDEIMGPRMRVASNDW